MKDLDSSVYIHGSVRQFVLTHKIIDAAFGIEYRESLPYRYKFFSHLYPEKKSCYGFVFHTHDLSDTDIDTLNIPQVLKQNLKKTKIRNSQDTRELWLYCSKRQYIFIFYKKDKIYTSSMCENQMFYL